MRGDVGGELQLNRVWSTGVDTYWKLFAGSSCLLLCSQNYSEQGQRCDEGTGPRAQGAGGECQEGQHEMAMRWTRAQWKCCLETKGPLLMAGYTEGRDELSHLCDG